METSFVEVKFDIMKMSVSNFHFDIKDLDLIVEFDFHQSAKGILPGAKSSMGVPEEPDEIIYETSISRVVMYMNDTEIDILCMKEADNPFFKDIFTAINNKFDGEAVFC